jgi:hypothetical protein
MAVASTTSANKVPAEVLNAVTVRALANAKNGKKKEGRKEVEQQEQLPLPQPQPQPQPQLQYQPQWNHPPFPPPPYTYYHQPPQAPQLNQQSQFPIPQSTAPCKSSPITEDPDLPPLINQYIDWLSIRYPRYIKLFNTAKEGFAEEVYTWQALYIKRNRDNCEDTLISMVEKKGT